MCLTLRIKFDKPYNSKRIRWKLVEVRDGKLTGPYTGFVYKKKAWNSSVEAKDSRNSGFHVFVHKSRASDYLSFTDSLALCKVEVNGFKKSGTWGGRKTETWDRMRILEIFDR